jgi:transcriptional regulator with XRE-family HTH domain
VEESADKTIGENVRRFREAQGLSQAQLAERLVDSGLAGFYPQTVLRVEKGTRPLRLAEAQVVAAVLNTELRALTEDPEETAMLRAVADAQKKRTAVLDAVLAYLKARPNAIAAFDRMSDRLEETAAREGRDEGEVAYVRRQLAELYESYPEDPHELLRQLLLDWEYAQDHGGQGRPQLVLPNAWAW